MVPDFGPFMDDGGHYSGFNNATFLIAINL